ncbi:2-hydroxyacid dehydrogenase [Glaciecola sp. 1036]|uniref:2-hydroxyacid dehydrogenase n=1 Tax=Alteromonadaceae TaxID=72275 RepID=UPI003D019185
MAFLINLPNRNVDKIKQCLTDKMTQKGISPIDIQVWPEVSKPDDITFALVWKHHAGSLTEYKNLAGISSFGAGVDAVFADSELPDVPIMRIVDDKMSTDMAQYVWTMIQHHRIGLGQFADNQTAKIWKPKSKQKGNKVGILGFGELGLTTAKLLSKQGFDVTGWRRSKKGVEDHFCVSGEQGFHSIIEQSDYLVCLLPLTEQTENILNQGVFSKMKNTAVLINVARGHHVVEQDLQEALETEQIAAAYLDVFRQEPLPEDHPFWTTKHLYITPHISAVTNLDEACEQIAENYKRSLENQPLINVVDRNLGY